MSQHQRPGACDVLRRGLNSTSKEGMREEFVVHPKSVNLSFKVSMIFLASEREKHMEGLDTTVLNELFNLKLLQEKNGQIWRANSKTGTRV